MRKQTIILSLVLLVGTLLALAATKPEPLTYKLGGRRYVIALPDKQLWSVSEVARAASGHASGTLFIDGQAVRQARVRGVVGDRTNHNYLVIVMRTGKRLSPLPRYFVRPDPWMTIKAPQPPGATKTLAAGKKPVVALLGGATVSLRLVWDDSREPAVPGGWGAGPDIMPDGGTKFWTVYSTPDFRTWRFCDLVTIPEFSFTAVETDRMFFSVHWRDEGAPAWRWP